MDYLTRLRKEHEFLQMVGLIFQELIRRLGTGKAVNLVDLEDIYRLCREYLVTQHLSSEEEHVFTRLRAEHHPSAARMSQAHEEIKSSIGKMGEIIGELRLGRPNSGKELVRTGEGFLWLLKTHLREEDRILTQLESAETNHNASLRDIPKAAEEWLRESRVLLQRLTLEYAGKEFDLSWMSGPKEESDRTLQGSSSATESTGHLRETDERKGMEEEEERAEIKEVMQEVIPADEDPAGDTQEDIVVVQGRTEEQEERLQDGGE
ncbi:MAG TPA: hypothetical protein GXZ36_03905 [Firmicutes bacterium]|nr:hypothetical protein [Bacillota bacterium]